MKLYFLVIFFVFSFSLTASEYEYNYQANNDLERGFYGIAGQANIQFKILKYVIPLDEDILTVSLSNPQYKSLQQAIDIFPGYASITDGQIGQPANSPSPIFPPAKTLTYQSYFKQGIQIVILKIPHQIYHYYDQKLETLDQAEIVITTKVRDTGYKKSRFLSNVEAFDRITKELMIEESVKDSYYSYYANPDYQERNSLGLDPTEMVIISPSGLITEWQLYADYKTALGLSTQVVNINNITLTYAGRDNAEKLRNFLVDIYTEWSSNETPLNYVLLGGDYNLVPARQLRIRASYNGSWNSNNVYSDLYYSGLDGDWDNDSDNLFGEGDSSQDSQATGTNGEEADLYAEVAVGRIPVETSDELENWINKQQDYESAQVDEQFYEKVLLLGERLSSTIYGAPSMNELANNLSDYSIQTLYAQNSTFSEASLTSAINNNVSQVHHLGHGSTTVVFSISSSDLTNNFVNQDYPFIYTQGCHTANLSTNDSIGESFVIHQRGAFAYIGNTSYGFYSSFENQGPSQLFHREFVDAYTNEGISKIGLAHSDGKEDLIGITGQTGTRRYVYFDNILFADPSTEIIKDLERVAIEQLSDTSIKLSFTGNIGSEVFTPGNYTIYQRDDLATTYPVSSVTQEGDDYILNFSAELPAGIPLRIKIENITNLLNPTTKLVKPLYTIKESSIITPTVWSAEESPIYVYKHQIINSTLTIEAGTEIRVNSNKSFYIYWGGQIQVQGDSLNYVTFTSYSDDSAQSDKWTDVTIMMDPSPDSYFNYALIKNSTSGIWLDSLSTITLDHVRFQDIENYGIYAKHSTVNADYLEFTGMTNSEGGAFRIIGGLVNLNHLTSAENAGWELIVTDSAQVTLKNSIIWGQSHLDSDFITIDYSILPEVITGTENLTSNPQFVSTSDLRLQSSSPAINSGQTTELDPDNTITDRGYWYYHYPNNFNAEIVLGSPKKVEFTNLSLGDYDTIEWDFDNDGVWDSQDLNPEHLYLDAGVFSVKMRLTKDSFQEDILLTDIIEQSLNPLQVNFFPVNITIDANQLELSWSPVMSTDLYQITSGIDLESDFSSLSIQEETSFTQEIDESRLKLYQIIPLEQIINIAD
ncbi:hypothetical protein JEZ13_02225 [bacterium]|nr:hypothetical protein [bacterium]